MIVKNLCLGCPSLCPSRDNVSYPCKWVGERSEVVMKKRLKLIESFSFIKRVCEKEISLIIKGVKL
jgi:hypothetical protein